MGILRSFLILVMLSLLLGVGYFYLSAKPGMSMLLLGGYLVATVLLSIHFLRIPAIEKAHQTYEAQISPWLLKHTWSILAVGAGLLFVSGQMIILKAVGTTKPELFSKSLGFGTLYCVAGLLVGLLAYWLKDRKPGVGTISNYAFLTAALVLGFSVWSGFFIYKTSFDMAEQGRYFCLFDDAMISLRYAWNLTHGLGLVWNPGERVEGYTNLLMTLYMAIGTLLLNKNMAVLFVQVSGVIFLLLIGFLHQKLAGTLLGSVPEERKGFYMNLAFASPLFYYPLVYWSVLGMETGLLCLLMSASLWLAFSEAKNPRFNPWLAVLLGLMTLVRPDAVVQVGFILLYRLYTILANRKNLFIFIGEALLFVVFPLGQLGFRLWYYHEWYPNTYLLKVVGFPLEARLVHGKKFIKLFMESAWLVTALSGLSLFIRYKKEKLLAVALFVSVNVYQVYIGGDPWIYWRIMAPYVGLLLILNLDVLDFIIGGLGSWFKPKPKSILNPLGFQQGAVLLVWLVLLAGLNLKFAPEIYFKVVPYSVDFNGPNVRTGLTLAKVCKPEAKAGVLWAGAIPYFSGVYGVDFLGKCDKTIASLKAEVQGAPGHNKYDLKYSIEELKPDYIQQYFWQGSDERLYAEANYVIIWNMWFLKGSPNVRWELLQQ